MEASKPLITQAWMPIKKLALLAVGKVMIKACQSERKVFMSKKLQILSGGCPP